MKFFPYKFLNLKIILLDGGNDDDEENNENEPSTTSNSSVFSMTASTPSVVISNGKPKVNPEDVTNTTCIRKGKNKKRECCK